MAILVQDVVNRCASALDAEGSEYYLFAQDYLPAILSAQDWVVSMINSQLGNKKLSEEIFSDLTLARVFQASAFSRVRLDPVALGHNIWTITSIEPNPVTTPTYSPQTLANPQDSKYRDDLSHLTSMFYAKRRTAEEWTRNVKNPFDDSHILETNEVVTNYGYLNYMNYTSIGYTLLAPPFEIEIRPSIGGLGCTIRYIQVPSRPTLIGDSLQFPAFVIDIMVQATLAFMAIKQGDQTTLAQLSKTFLSMLIGDTQ